MKHIVIPIVAGIIIICIVLLWFFGVGVSEKFETENEFGSWGQEIIFEFPDGNLQSLKSAIDIPRIALFTSDNEEIVGIYYQLSAKASGEGTDTIQVDISEYQYTLKTLKTSGLRVGDTGTKNVYIYKQGIPTNVDIAVDNNYHQVCKIQHPKSVLAFEDDYGQDLEGMYAVSISPKGSLQYSLDGVNWIPADLPDTITFYLSAKNDPDNPGEITVFVSFSNYHVGIEP